MTERQELYEGACKAFRESMGKNPLKVFLPAFCLPRNGVLLRTYTLAVVFDSSGQFFDPNLRTFFFLTLEFVRRLRETTTAVVKA